MKVITIKQPYASLIAEGYKQYEFRSWKTKYRGSILIHAGMGVDKAAMERFAYLNLTYPQGMIIAKCELSDCIQIDDNMKKKLKEQDPLVYKNISSSSNNHKYGFKLENIEKIEPIPAKGKLSFWEYDYKEK